MAKRKKQDKITRSAKGEQCQLLLAPHGCDSEETTVLCHAPHIDNGTGTKGASEWSVYGCNTCHAIMDGRAVVEWISKDDINHAVYYGIQRTQAKLKAKGLLVVNL